MAPIARKWEDISEGETITTSLIVTLLDMKAFREFSGDMNPIHWDADFARSKGYQRPLVYGGLLISKLSRIIGMELPGQDAIWATLDIQFRNPLMVNEAAKLEATVIKKSNATKLIKLAFTITTPEKKIATAIAKTFLKDG